MSQWRSSKARQVFAALKRVGWTFKRQVGETGTDPNLVQPTSIRGLSPFL